MGAADLVPGVSGGTMAFILGIYQQLLDALHAFNLELIRLILGFRWKQALQIFPWRFLLSLGLGILTAIVGLSRSIHWALENHPSLVSAFFFGLVLASAAIVRKRVNKWSLGLILITILTMLLTYSLVGLSPLETPHTPLMIFLSGAIAICAMILPGISGAFILLLLGKYRFILGALINVDLFVIALFGIGCVIGLLSFARLLRWLIGRFHDPTVAALTGLMIGSLRKVWPWQIPIGEGTLSNTLILPETFSLYVGAAISLMLTGFLVVWTIEKIAARRSSAEK